VEVQIFLIVCGAVIGFIVPLIFKQFVIRTKSGRILENISNEHNGLFSRMTKVENDCKVIEHLLEITKEMERNLNVMTPCVYALMIQAEYPDRKANGEFTKAKEEMRKYVLYRNN